MSVETWLERNTFHYSEFWDLRQLIQRKEEQRLTVSVCLPTLNEEKTIGKEVVVLKSELMDRYSLVDELAVIDSGSTDGTREVAAQFGADVYLASEILPRLGHKRGKGENLWKAIYQLTGDIICYIDADIKNIHAGFAYGLIAPLIYRPEIKYLKAFYDRPLVLSQGVRPSGGGRVTEILIRPLFSLLYPELTAIIQPLSGEYAVRREVLEALPFPIGYGVETSHMLDVYSKYGLEAFGQTDMGQRVHRNQATRDLGKMAFGILQTFLRRTQSLATLGDHPGLSTVLRQFQFKKNRYEQLEYHFAEEERPPMVDVREYKEKFSLSR